MERGRQDGTTAGRARPARFSGTKFVPPSPPAWFVPRPALVAALDRAVDLPLAVVVASPGAGKTTLLADWARSRPRGSVAWVSVDPADRDPARFWQAVITSIQRVAPDFAAEAYDLLTLDGSVQPDALESLLAACESLERPVTLVVDDLHLTATDVADHLRFLATRGQGRLHVVVGTRQEPLGLARLRLDGAIGEVRDADLRFGADEVVAFVTGMGLTVSEPDLGVLRDRTEGWAAGVHLATVALRDQGQAAGFVQRLAGTNQAISQYLSYEVVDAQSPEVQRFLLDTCVVDELTPQLAAALSPESGVTLHEVEAAGLLLSRLDPAAEVYRFHHLLSEMLRARLHVVDPERERLLHARAAAHHEGLGRPREAFPHRWRAGDARGALGLVAGLGPDYHLAAEAHDVEKLRVPLSDADIAGAPGPSVAHASTLASVGLVDDALELTARIERLAHDRLTESERDQLLATRACVLTMADRNREVIDLVEPARTARTEASAADGWRDLADAVLLRAFVWEDRFERAEAMAAERPLEQVSVELLSAVALVHLERGELERAIGLVRPALPPGVLDGPDPIPLPLLPVMAVLGSALLERGELADAERMLHEFVTRRAAVRPGMVVLARLGLARLLRAEARLDAARVVLHPAFTASGPAAASGLSRRVACLEARLLLESGARTEAAGVLDGLPAEVRTDLVRAELARTEGRDEDAVALLDGAQDLAATPRQHLEVAVARLAHACDAGEPPAELVADVLERAETVGATFLVAEGGSAALAAVLAEARRRPQTAFLRRLAATRPHAVAPTRANATHPMDALSERERTVLRYLVTSLSYKEIAEELYVSVNTVKTHVKNIIRKLHATSRADAIARARDLHYL